VSAGDLPNINSDFSSGFHAPWAHELPAFDVDGTASCLNTFAINLAAIVMRGHDMEDTT